MQRLFPLTLCLLLAAPAAALEPADPPRDGLLTAHLAYARLTPASAALMPSQDTFVGQLGYARRIRPSGWFLGAGMEFGFAEVGAHGLRKALGAAVHGGWDIGAAQAVVLEGYAAPVYVWTQGEPLSRASGAGLVAGATLALPWLQRTFVDLAGSHLPESILAAPLVLLPNAVGVRAQHLPGDGRERVGVTVGWSFAMPVWHY